MQFQITLDSLSNGKLQRPKGKREEKRVIKRGREKSLASHKKDFTVNSAKSTVNNIWNCRSGTKGCGEHPRALKHKPLLAVPEL